MTITQQDLARAQLEFWPDSKLLTISEALGWIAEAYQATDEDQAEVNACGGWLSRVSAAERINLKRMDRSKGVAQSLAVALANAVESGTPVQFYLCGFNPGTGKYRYRGCRFGINGSEYMSGFGFF